MTATACVFGEVIVTNYGVVVVVTVAGVVIVVPGTGVWAALASFAVEPDDDPTQYPTTIVVRVPSNCTIDVVVDDSGIDREIASSITGTNVNTTMMDTAMRP